MNYSDERFKRDLEVYDINLGTLICFYLDEYCFEDELDEKYFCEDSDELTNEGLKIVIDFFKGLSSFATKNGEDSRIIDDHIKNLESELKGTLLERQKSLANDLKRWYKEVNTYEYNDKSYGIDINNEIRIVLYDKDDEDSWVEGNDYFAIDFYERHLDRDNFDNKYFESLAKVYWEFQELFIGEDLHNTTNNEIILVINYLDKMNIRGEL